MGLVASLVIRKASHVKREASESGMRYASHVTRNIQRQFQISSLGFHVFG